MTQADDRLVSILDEALFELRRRGNLDTRTWRTRHPEAGDELEGLLETLQALDTAAESWKIGPPTDTQQTTTDPADGSKRRPGTAPLPEKIGRYRILGQIGSGGMGTVYRAEDPQLQRLVAIKVPHFDRRQPATSAGRQRFLREARAAAAVRHAHVCPIYDVGEHDGSPYVVMALVEGPALQERLRAGGRFEDVRIAVKLAVQVADALAAVHAHGLVHRDLKPGNILLDSNGDALLTDFGLARPEHDSEHLTTDGILVGTPAYMAPEQAAGHKDKIGPRTDVYSLGVVLYQMLTGRLPFAGPTVALLHKIAYSDPPSPSEFRSDLDSALVTILNTAMANQPGQRFASASAFADALRQWLAAPAETRLAPLTPAKLAAVTSATPAVVKPAPVAVEVAQPPERRPSVVWLIAAIGGLAAVALVAVAGALLLAGGALLALRPATNHTRPEPVAEGGPVQPGEPPAVKPPPPAEELAGDLVVRVWSDRGKGRKRGWAVDEPGALPVVNGEKVRLDVKLNRGAYQYIVWVDASGKTQPVYPWDPNQNEDWATPMPAQDPRAVLSLPTGAADHGLEVDGPAGLDTIILLARAEPLPAGTDLNQLIGTLPRSEFVNRQEVAWLELTPGQLAARHPKPPLNRGIKTGQSKQIDEPVLKMLERLRSHFDLIKAVRFARVEN